MISQSPLLVCATLLCFTIHVTCGSGVLTIRLTGFKNTFGRTYDGTCCDPTPKDRGSNCYDQCDYVMRLIVTGLGRANDHVFLFHRPLTYDSNNIVFQNGDSNLLLTVLFDEWPEDDQVKMNAFFYDYDDFDHTTTLVDWFETDLRHSTNSSVDSEETWGNFQQQTVVGNRQTDKTTLTFEWSALQHTREEHTTTRDKLTFTTDIQPTQVIRLSTSKEETRRLRQSWSNSQDDSQTGLNFNEEMETPFPNLLKPTVNSDQLKSKKQYGGKNVNQIAKQKAGGVRTEESLVNGSKHDSIKGLDATTNRNRYSKRRTAALLKRKPAKANMSKAELFQRKYITPSIKNINRQEADTDDVALIYTTSSPHPTVLTLQEIQHSQLHNGTHIEDKGTANNVHKLPIIDNPRRSNRFQSSYNNFSNTSGHPIGRRKIYGGIKRTQTRHKNSQSIFRKEDIMSKENNVNHNGDAYFHPRATNKDTQTGKVLDVEEPLALNNVKVTQSRGKTYRNTHRLLHNRKINPQYQRKLSLTEAGTDKFDNNSKVPKTSSPDIDNSMNYFVTSRKRTNMPASSPSNVASINDNEPTSVVPYIDSKWSVSALFVDKAPTELAITRSSNDKNHSSLYELRNEERYMFENSDIAKSNINSHQLSTSNLDTRGKDALDKVTSAPLTTNIVSTRVLSYMSSTMKNIDSPERAKTRFQGARTSAQTDRFGGLDNLKQPSPKSFDNSYGTVLSQQRGLEKKMADIKNMARYHSTQAKTRRKIITKRPIESYKTLAVVSNVGTTLRIPTIPDNNVTPSTRTGYNLSNVPSYTAQVTLVNHSNITLKSEPSVKTKIPINAAASADRPPLRHWARKDLRAPEGTLPHHGTDRLNDVGIQEHAKGSDNVTEMTYKTQLPVWKNQKQVIVSNISNTDPQYPLVKATNVIPNQSLLLISYTSPRALVSSKAADKITNGAFHLRETNFIDSTSSFGITTILKRNGEQPSTELSLEKKDDSAEKVVDNNKVVSIPHTDVTKLKGINYQESDIPAIPDKSNQYLTEKKSTTKDSINDKLNKHFNSSDKEADLGTQDFGHVDPGPDKNRNDDTAALPALKTYKINFTSKPILLESENEPLHIQSTDQPDDTRAKRQDSEPESDRIDLNIASPSQKLFKFGPKTPKPPTSGELMRHSIKSLKAVRYQTHAPVQWYVTAQPVIRKAAINFPEPVKALITKTNNKTAMSTTDLQNAQDIVRVKSTSQNSISHSDKENALDLLGVKSTSQNRISHSDKENELDPLGVKSTSQNRISHSDKENALDLLGVKSTSQNRISDSDKENALDLLAVTSTSQNRISDSDKENALDLLGVTSTSQNRISDSNTTGEENALDLLGVKSTSQNRISDSDTTGEENALDLLGVKSTSRNHISHSDTKLKLSQIHLLTHTDNWNKSIIGSFNNNPEIEMKGWEQPPFDFNAKSQERSNHESNNFNLQLPLAQHNHSYKNVSHTGYPRHLSTDSFDRVKGLNQHTFKLDTLSDSVHRIRTMQNEVITQSIVDTIRHDESLGSASISQSPPSSIEANYKLKMSTKIPPTPSDLIDKDHKAEVNEHSIDSSFREDRRTNKSMDIQESLRKSLVSIKFNKVQSISKNFNNGDILGNLTAVQHVAAPSHNSNRASRNMSKVSKPFVESLIKYNKSNVEIKSGETAFNVSTFNAPQVDAFNVKIDGPDKSHKEDINLNKFNLVSRENFKEKEEKLLPVQVEKTPLEEPHKDDTRLFDKQEMNFAKNVHEHISVKLSLNEGTENPTEALLTANPVYNMILPKNPLKQTIASNHGPLRNVNSNNSRGTNNLDYSTDHKKLVNQNFVDFSKSISVLQNRAKTNSTQDPIFLTEQNLVGSKESSENKKTQSLIKNLKHAEKDHELTNNFLMTNKTATENYVSAYERPQIPVKAINQTVTTHLTPMNPKEYKLNNTTRSYQLEKIKQEPYLAKIELEPMMRSQNNATKKLEKPTIISPVVTKLTSSQHDKKKGVYDNMSSKGDIPERKMVPQMMNSSILSSERAVKKTKVFDNNSVSVKRNNPISLFQPATEKSDKLALKGMAQQKRDQYDHVNDTAVRDTFVDRHDKVINVTDKTLLPEITYELPNPTTSKYYRSHAAAKKGTHWAINRKKLVVSPEHELRRPEQHAIVLEVALRDEMRNSLNSLKTSSHLSSDTKMSYQSSNVNVTTNKSIRSQNTNQTFSSANLRKNALNKNVVSMTLHPVTTSTPRATRTKTRLTFDDHNRTSAIKMTHSSTSERTTTNNYFQSERTTEVIPIDVTVETQVLSVRNESSRDPFEMMDLFMAKQTLLGAIVQIHRQAAELSNPQNTTFARKTAPENITFARKIAPKNNKTSLPLNNTTLDTNKTTSTAEQFFGSSTKVDLSAETSTRNRSDGSSVVTTFTQTKRKADIILEMTTHRYFEEKQKPINTTASSTNQMSLLKEALTNKEPDDSIISVTLASTTGTRGYYTTEFKAYTNMTTVALPIETSTSSLSSPARAIVPRLLMELNTREYLSTRSSQRTSVGTTTTLPTSTIKSKMLENGTVRINVHATKLPSTVTSASVSTTSKHRPQVSPKPIVFGPNFDKDDTKILYSVNELSADDEPSYKMSFPMFFVQPSMNTLPEQGFILHTLSPKEGAGKPSVLAPNGLPLPKLSRLNNTFRRQYIYREMNLDKFRSYVKAIRNYPTVNVPFHGLYTTTTNKSDIIHPEEIPAELPDPVRRYGSFYSSMSNVGSVFTRYWPAVLGVSIGTIFLVTALVTSILCRQRRLLIQRARWTDSPQHVSEPPDTSECTSSSEASLTSDLTRSSINLM